MLLTGIADMLMRAVARQTDMPHKGELQTLTKLSMIHQVCHAETCRTTYQSPL